MTMTHKEALVKAARIYEEHDGLYSQSMAAAIRTYVDALGLVLVPREATEEMREAGERWSVMPAQVWDDMLAAAPDPFAQGERE